MCIRDSTQSAQYHFDLAKKLQKLREKGILIIGSGNVVHNLRSVSYTHLDVYKRQGLDCFIPRNDYINIRLHI